MNSSLQRSSKSGRQSLFYRDLASPISAHRGSGGGRFATPGQAAAVSALWRENFSAAADPPPPPIFTLDDRADFSPEPQLGDLQPASPSSPTPARRSFSSPSPLKSKFEEQQQLQRSPGTSNWWSPLRSGDEGLNENEKGSPVDGMVQTRALIALPPPREVARPELPQDSLLTGVLHDEEWVTVYGFSIVDTNLVLREFEKCGVILKHVPGPRDSNWMHILYQNRYDAQKALHKDGMQINSILIIGVKLVDPIQRQFLNERINSSSYGGFMVSLPPKSSTVKGPAALSPMGASPRCNHLLTSDSGRRASGAIASPSKSVVSKVVDLLFGL